jgi:hypothetical protein
MANPMVIPVTKADLFGDLYYSQRQWKELRDKGRDRTFAKLVSGEIKEYTELVPANALPEDREILILYEDAVQVGVGAFDHFTDEKGRPYK